MKIEFVEGVTEYANGEIHYHKDKQPFDVDARVGKDLIATGYFQEEAVKEDKPKKADKEKK